MYRPPHSLKVYDYYLFAQDVSELGALDARRHPRHWFAALVTVGQDEAVFKIVCLQPTGASLWIHDEPLLVAERLLLGTPFWPSNLEIHADPGNWSAARVNLTKRPAAHRKTKPRSLSARSPLRSFKARAAIEWLWNTNSYMTESNETSIGAVTTSRKA